MEKLSPLEAYVPVSVEDELPKLNAQVIIIVEHLLSNVSGIHLREATVRSDYSYGEAPYLSPKEPLYKYDEITHWLKHLPSHYLFSKEEIERLIGEAFDAGVTLGRDYELSGGCPAARNKNDYIKNLLP